MRDIRVDRWADVIVNYSLQAKKGQTAVIQGDIEGLPLLTACYEKLLKAGAFVETYIFSDAWNETLFKFGGDDQISKPHSGLVHATSTCDIYLRIGSDGNSKLLANFPPSKQTLASKAREPILKNILNRSAEKKMRWAYTFFPTAAAAQEADMGTLEFEEFIFSLGHLNDADPVGYWQKIEAQQQKLVDFLDTKKEIRFQNQEGTDLRVNVAGMKWVNCCGKINFPDGEVYTGPKLDAPDGGVNGIARYSFPTLYRNVEVRDIELIFKNGAVVEANASKGQTFLREMIAQDPGAKFVGEIAIGTNYNMNRITKNILFDEKFGGTFHLALGRGYPQTGNTNQSALHWDMIFDLRKGGTITADGELIHKDGNFVIS